MAESNTTRPTCFIFVIFVTLVLVFSLLGIVGYLIVTRPKTSPMESSSSNIGILLSENEKSSSTSKTHLSDTTDPLTTQSTSSSQSATDIVYSDYGDVISLIVPETQDVVTRIQRAKSLKHEGRNDAALSDTLIDLLGFGSKCEFLDKDGTDKEPRRPDFDTLLIVHSSPSHIDLRNIIRNTWGNPDQCRRNRVLLRFVMGSPRTDLDAQRLKNESEAFADILVGNFTDRVTRASTFKSLLAIRWALSLQCPVNFVIYSDDYSFMMLEKLPDLKLSFQEHNQFKSIHGSLVVYHVDLHHADYHNENPLIEREFYPPTCDTDIGCITPFVLAVELYTKFIWTTRVPLNHFALVLGLAAEEYEWMVRHSDEFSSHLIEGPEEACELKKKCTARMHNIDLIQQLWEILSDPHSMNYCE